MPLGRRKFPPAPACLVHGSVMPRRGALFLLLARTEAHGCDPSRLGSQRRSPSLVMLSALVPPLSALVALHGVGGGKPGSGGAPARSLVGSRRGTRTAGLPSRPASTAMDDARRIYFPAAGPGGEGGGASPGAPRRAGPRVRRAGEGPRTPMRDRAPQPERRARAFAAALRRRSGVGRRGRRELRCGAQAPLLVASDLADVPAADRRPRARRGARRWRSRCASSPPRTPAPSGR